MTINPIHKAALTPELARRAKLDPAALALLQPSHTPMQFLQALAGGHPVAAVRLLAWALDRREAVAWAASCVDDTLTAADCAEERAAVEAAARWAASPTEENRRAAEAAAVAVDFGTPGGCAATAAFWAEGSLSPPKQPAVPPPEHLLPGAVVNALLLAAVRADPEKAEEKYRRFLARGLEIAEGKNRQRPELGRGKA